ncbi:MAG: hypothetical protein PHR35_15190, partial [Kiritimatiellae bacterium]|nr:hypothetical protein [Kiritimatiellia bacterium]
MNTTRTDRHGKPSCRGPKVNHSSLGAQRQSAARTNKTGRSLAWALSIALAGGLGALAWAEAPAPAKSAFNGEPYAGAWRTYN